MFQSFDATSDPANGGPRLAALRSEMSRTGLDGFWVPRADAHQGEYVCDHDERLSWLTGFTGSAGFCIALTEVAGVFIDGRYRLQIQDQVDPAHFTPVHWPEVKPAHWLIENLPNGGRIGYDPWLHTQGSLDKVQEELGDSGITLQPCPNLIDAIWPDQPPQPRAKMVSHPVALAGAPHLEKLKSTAQALTKAGQNAVVLTLPDSIAWLLNTRGGDIDRIPVTLCFAILHDTGGLDLFLHPDKIDDRLLEHLGAEITVRTETEFTSALGNLTGTVRVDKDSAPAAVTRILLDANVDISYDIDPVILPKACKSEAEVAGARAAHIRDGVAMARFLAWIDETAATGSLSEIDVVTRLEDFRRDTNQLRDISFDTICGSGPNGAIVHYRVTHDTNRQIGSGDVLLVDSGAQYADGTTDITRTLAVGDVSPDAKRAFTLVLKGMIAISDLRFPDSLSGMFIDSFARAPLWSAGLDFDHGTGHGVGAFLSVHEGPQRISRLSDQVLLPGMILSNEPGYYRTGAFGIRIENLVVVQPAPEIDGADARKMNQFETLTLAPIDRRMIQTEMLTTAEINWLNGYHKRIVETLTPLCDSGTGTWLETACRPLLG